MRIFKLAAAILGFIVVSILLFIGVQANRRPPVDTYASLTLPSAPQGAKVTVRFAGVTTLMFDDGETAFMTDGFFSRPDMMSTALLKIGPDEQAIDAGLAALNARKLAAVITLHGHYDHALDSAVVAKKTSALLIGDESTLNIGRGAGLPEASMRKVKGNDTVNLGKWRLTFIESRHAPGPFSTEVSEGEIIAQPLTPPARATAWHRGETWSLLVEHQSGRSYLIQGSAGFVEGGLRGRHADVVFLSVGAAGKQSHDYRAKLWAEVPEAVGAKRVVLVHWDDFWQGLDRPLVAMPYLTDDFAATMKDMQYFAARDGVDLRLPPLFRAFDPTPAF